MPISSRFVINFTAWALTIALVALIVIEGAAIWLGERTQTAIAISNAARDVRVASVELRSALQSAETSQRGYLIGGNEIYLAPYDTSKSQAKIQLSRVTELLRNETGKTQILQRLSQLVAEKIADMDASIELKRSRRDIDALSAFQSNRGKSLMDEANLFLSSIIRTSDASLNDALSEQRQNARALRWVSTIGGLTIVLVVAGAIMALARYSKEASDARKELASVNASLEQRVADRTADLEQARDRAQVLLAEVNHRVANSLAMVASMVRLTGSSSGDPNLKETLSEVEARIQAIASVHKRLYTSGNTETVDLDEYLASLLGNIESAMRTRGHAATVRTELQPISLKTDASVNLGIIVAEWVTNAYKYAYPKAAGEIRVRLKRTAAEDAVLTVEDDGIGMAGQSAVQGTGIGNKIVSAMARALGGTVEYQSRNPGFSAILQFPSPPMDSLRESNP